MMLGVVRAAGLATVQDGGRRGFADVGVPVSGAWHRERYLLGVALVTGRFDDRVPAIEVLGGALSVEFARPVVLSVSGPADLRIDGRPAAAGACLAVAAGARLDLHHVGPGPCYLVVDGFAPERVLGSAATDTFSSLGPPPLSAGDQLDGSAPGDGAGPGAFLRVRPEPTGPLRMIPTADAARTVATGWRVHSVARSGVRMRGPDVTSRSDIPSMPVLPGAVQVTPAGEAVILGPDGGLTGGYPVIGVIVSADLDRISTLRPGDTVSLRAASVDEACEAWVERERSRRGLLNHVDLLH